MDVPAATAPQPDYARWTRVAAFVLDQAALWPVSLLLADTNIRLVALVLFCVFVGWRAAWTATKGATPGKLLLGIEICEATGTSRPRPWQAVVRELPIGVLFLVGAIHPIAGVVALFFVFPLLGLVTIGMVHSDDGRTIGDHLAGTIAMERVS